jgi:hypothetical protein
MENLDEGMRRVAAVAARVGPARLAREAGIPITTVRSFRDRDWELKSLPTCLKLIAAAERIDARSSSAA